MAERINRRKFLKGAGAAALLLVPKIVSAGSECNSVSSEGRIVRLSGVTSRSPGEGYTELTVSLLDALPAGSRVEIVDAISGTNSQVDFLRPSRPVTLKGFMQVTDEQGEVKRVVIDPTHTYSAEVLRGDTLLDKTPSFSPLEGCSPKIR